MANLPKTDREQILRLRKEYEELQKKGSPEASEACFRLIWGLVHSERQRDVEEGLKLAHVLLASDTMDPARQKDLVYFCCVAKYNLGHYLEAREQTTEFLQSCPNNRQAQCLKEDLDKKVINNGLIGLGIIGATAAAGVAIAAAFARR